MTKVNCILSYEITKGMKSFGPKGLLKNTKSLELINLQIQTVNHDNNKICIIMGFGAEKLNKKINHTKYDTIHNEYFDELNEGYAIELLLSKYKELNELLIISSGILIDIKDIKLNSSSIFITNKQKSNLNLSCVFNDNNLLEHIFYDIGNNYWCEVLFLCKKEIDILKKLVKKISIKNMFLFEIINTIITNGGLLSKVQIPPSKIIKIQSMKDANKIKEIV